MSRDQAAFANVERRIDRDADAAREREQREFICGFVKTGLDGLLGAFSADRQRDILREVIPQASARYKALTDGPVMASLLGMTSAKLNPEIQGGKSSAREIANAKFKTGGAAE